MDELIDNWYDGAIANGQGFQSAEERQAYIDSIGMNFESYVLEKIVMYLVSR